jgi:hypothetical protein
MFELVQALNDGVASEFRCRLRLLSPCSNGAALRNGTPNPISLNAGCELFIAFVTLFPHESDVRLPFLFVYFSSFFLSFCFSLSPTQEGH